MGATSSRSISAQPAARASRVRGFAFTASSRTTRSSSARRSPSTSLPAKADEAHDGRRIANINQVGEDTMMPADDDRVWERLQRAHQDAEPDDPLWTALSMGTLPPDEAEALRAQDPRKYELVRPFTEEESEHIL